MYLGDFSRVGTSMCRRAFPRLPYKQCAPEVRHRNFNCSSLETEASNCEMVQDFPISFRMTNLSVSGYIVLARCTVANIKYVILKLQKRMLEDPDEILLFNLLLYDLVSNYHRHNDFVHNDSVGIKTSFMFILCLRLFRRSTIHNRKVILNLYLKKR